MALAKDEVIVIKNNDFSEADKIIVVFGKNRGKYSLIAKGVRKVESKNRPAVQTLARSKITYYEGRNLGVVVEASLLEQVDVDRDQLENISKTLLVLNKLLPEEEEEVQVYKKYVEVLEGPLDIRSINRFRMWLLEYLGYLPDMRSCSNCGNRKDLSGVDLVNMQVICAACRKIVNGKYQNIEDIRYEGNQMDKALDNFIQRVIEQ